MQSDATLGVPVEHLVRLLDLESLDVDLFRGVQPTTRKQRVYGGQVAAQSLMAAIHTVDPDYRVHSLHSYFLLPGDYAVPIIYDVERIRDGRSFMSRRVVARQHGRPIYFQTVSFHRPEGGYEHSQAMPDVADPEDCVDYFERMRSLGHSDDDALESEWTALDIRWVGDSRDGLPENPADPARAQMWIRLRAGLPDDPAVHAAAFTFASDLSLLGTSLAAHEIGPRAVQAASLDHSLWFHRPFQADQWWLYDQVSPMARGARGFAVGRVFTREGDLVATAAQEALIRPARP